MKEDTKALSAVILIAAIIGGIATLHDLVMALGPSLTIWSALSAVISLLSSLAMVALAVLGYFQWKTLRSQERLIKTLVPRPCLFVRVEIFNRLHIDNSVVLNVAARISNRGNGPAVLISSNLRSILAKAPPADIAGALEYFHYDNSIGIGELKDIAVGGPNIEGGATIQPIPAEMVRELACGRLNVYVVGRIRYRDICFNDYETAVCLHFAWVGRQLMPKGGAARNYQT